MSSIVFCDLDRTLIYSRAALGPDPGELTCVEVYGGASASFMTGAALRDLRALRARVPFVPTSTRTVAQLQRVRLPGSPARWAIAANGGHILERGVSDPEWRAAVGQRLAAGCAPRPEVEAWFARRAGAPWLRRTREADGLFVYALVERAALPAGDLDELTAWAAERGWSTSLQGRKLYVVPAPLTKSAAAAEVAVRAGARRTLAAGDSLLDTDLLDFADHAVRPAHGELHDAGWTRPGLFVTPHTGARGGAEVVAELLRRVVAQ